MTIQVIQLKQPITAGVLALGSRQQYKPMRSRRQLQWELLRDDPGNNTLKQTIAMGVSLIAMGSLGKENQEGESAVDDEDILIKGSSGCAIPGCRPSHQTEHRQTSPGGDALHVVL